MGKKNLSTASPPDQVFKNNFRKNFSNNSKPKIQKPAFLDSFIPKYLTSIEHKSPAAINNGNKCNQEIDFTQVANFID